MASLITIASMARRLLDTVADEAMLQGARTVTVTTSIAHDAEVVGNLEATFLALETAEAASEWMPKSIVLTGFEIFECDILPDEGMFTCRVGGTLRLAPAARASGDP
ncbi:hypothetical protein [Phreatobacter stygius]|uniref:Uncharacterized protein n=1 Tax=Phreatobacter stygius TaxID=1940610 RepID=A0A4D7AUM5_9HYPH|nr:hypothetical protein [Phreatobacter stygius]QCI64579.1 hypothetical protein E8M01_10265 [Phreatobacter stygius]